MADDKNLGFYNKFTVTRADGQSEPGYKHAHCDYFVLDMTHDPHVWPAILAYADACEKEYPYMAADLRAKHAQAMKDKDQSEMFDAKG